MWWLNSPLKMNAKTIGNVRIAIMVDVATMWSMNTSHLAKSVVEAPSHLLNGVVANLDLYGPDGKEVIVNS